MTFCRVRLLLKLQALDCNLGPVSFRAGNVLSRRNEGSRPKVVCLAWHVNSKICHVSLRVHRRVAPADQLRSSDFACLKSPQQIRTQKRPQEPHPEEPSKIHFNSHVTVATCPHTFLPLGICHVAVVPATCAGTDVVLHPGADRRSHSSGPMFIVRVQHPTKVIQGVSSGVSLFVWKHAATEMAGGKGSNTWCLPSPGLGALDGCRKDLMTLKQLSTQHIVWSN